MVGIVFRAVVLTSVTWIWCFVLQGCCEDRGVERDGVDMYGEDGVEMYVEERDGMFIGCDGNVGLLFREVFAYFEGELTNM